MWRTVVISSGEKVTVRDNWLVVTAAGKEKSVPIDDLYSVIIDNQETLFSTAVMTELTGAGVHVIFCDRKHLPAADAVPLNIHHQPLPVVTFQLNAAKQFKDELWEIIIRQKILNQSLCLRFANVRTEKVEQLEFYASEVVTGDKKNKESIAAKLYFPALFGAGFRRSDDDITNAALNYGYSIIRSGIAKTLVGYGFNSLLGIHHIGAGNYFNLADDLIEPFRPLVDLWTDTNCDNLFGSLTRQNRNELIGLMNYPMIFDGKKMRVRYIIDRYVSSLSSAFLKKDASLLKVPELMRLDDFFEDDLDDQ